MTNINSWIAITTVIGFPLFGLIYSFFNKKTKNMFVPKKFSAEYYEKQRKKNKKNNSSNTKTVIIV